MVIDLTLQWEDGMLTFPGYPTFQAEKLSRYEPDGHVSHEFSATSHTGTHIDAPSHYIEDGTDINDLNLETFNGPAKVIDLRAYQGEAISADVLESESPSIGSGERLILITGDVDRLPPDNLFFKEASTLKRDGAEWLVERDVSLLANDFLTEGVEDPERPIHHTLLSNNIPIIEYLSNTDAIADQADVELTCLPLLLTGFEAAPARVVAAL